jgi:hypothetical protein
MTLAAAPHPPSVFRYLKQAWRDYVASGNAQTLTINLPANQPAASAFPLVVTGSVLVDASVPQPVLVSSYLMTGAGTILQGMSAYASTVTGVWTVTFTAGGQPPGLYKIFAATDYGPGVASANFTLT